MTIGIRELKNNLSHYIRKVEQGNRISVTAHGRVVAELVPPASQPKSARKVSRWDQMIADGHVQLPTEPGDPFDGDTLEATVPPGSSREWLDWSREDK